MRLGFFSETILVCYLAFLSPAAAQRVILAVRDRLRDGRSRLLARARAGSRQIAWMSRSGRLERMRRGSDAG